jgi:3-deoxy-D-manno-octulosonic-acid transferase
MNLLLYRAILLLALPLVRARLVLRARKEPAYGERVAERFGRVPDGVTRGPIWFHTVSAGETIAAAPLIRELAGEWDQPFLVTTMTPTGSEQVLERLSGVVEHCYAPYDFTFAVRRFLDRVRPRLLVLMETELWPNLIHEAHARDVPVVCVNARLSEKSARGYAKLGRLTRDMLGQIHQIACQTHDHRQRFIDLGASPSDVTVLGNVKFDVDLPEALVAERGALRTRLGCNDRPVWIAASTHPGEDEIVVDAFAKLRTSIPELCLILVPRHPVRADDVVDLATLAGLTVVKQSECDSDTGPHDVVVGDVMGSLLALYGVADVAFVGGSFAAVGGHNPIEPALWEIPVTTGPQQFNFPDVMAELESAGGLRTVQDSSDLVAALTELLSDERARVEMGAKAHEVVVRNRGASARLSELLRAEIARTSLE